MKCLFTLVRTIILLWASAALVSAQQAPASRLLLQKHLGPGLNCSQCHEEAPPSQAVKTQQCLKCHGSFDALADSFDIRL